jgi:hypothetical protein
MLIWNGEAIAVVSDDEGAEMIKSGAAVEVGPFDGARVFPTKQEMAEASGGGFARKHEVADDSGSGYSTKDMTAKKSRSARKGEQ